MAQLDLTHPAGEWRNGLFSGICGADNAGLCLGSWFCSPCLYGQTTARLEQFPNPESPDFVGGNCFLMYAAGCCGFNWVVALMKRKEIREKFGIIGNTGVDCLVGSAQIRQPDQPRNTDQYLNRPRVSASPAQWHRWRPKSKTVRSSLTTLV